MTANVDAMVRAGMEAYRAGNKAEARTLLERAIELDQYNENAWLWLSAVVTSREEQKTCLENVIVINPQNERARQGLKSLGIDPDSVVKKANQASAPAFSEFDEGYEVPSSSVSSTGKDSNLSASDYDSWVQGLGLGGQATTGTKPPSSGKSAPTPQNDIFSSNAFSGDASFDFGNEDVFSGAAYDNNTGYQQDEFDFGNDTLEGEYDYGQEDYATDDDFDYRVDNTSDDLYGNSDEIADFDNAMDGGMFDEYDEDEFKVEKKPVKAVTKGAAPALDDAFDDEPLEIDQLFKLIPAEIKAGRLPGTDEKVPASARIITTLLTVGNIAALAFVVFQFLT